MDESERREVLAVLARTRDEYLASLGGVSDAQARWHPAPDQWSVLDCTEHVAVSERGMLQLITVLATPRGEPDRPGREAAIGAMTVDRSRRLDAPTGTRPRGRYATLDEAAAKFRSNRDATLAFVTTCAVDLRTLETTHPLAGLMTASECLSVLAAHPLRHAAQVRELRARPDFPA